MILTFDLGTSVTKAALWDRAKLVGFGRSRLRTRHAPGGLAEQDPAQWWESVCKACALAFYDARAKGAQAAQAEVEVVGFSAARQSFVPVDETGRSLGQALLWSDRRAAREAGELVAKLGGAEKVFRRTGIHPDAGWVPAKIAWLASYEPERLEAARWLLSPRDLVLWHMTGEVVTDETLASATGLYEGESLAEDLLEAAFSTRGQSSPPVGSRWSASTSPPAAFFPIPVPPGSVAGMLLERAAGELGLTAHLPVVAGAGDRACEVLGAGASEDTPMVSWGTTANVSVPLADLPETVPYEIVLTRSACGGWLLEGGLAAAGSLIDWLAETTTRDRSGLVEGASRVAPGAGGLTFLPWLGGARAPWWRSDAEAAVAGLRPDHGPEELARAALEGVAFDLARCIEAMYRGERGHPGDPGRSARLGSRHPRGLVLAGAGSRSELWVRVVCGATGLAAASRGSGEAASAGAAILAGRAVGMDLDLDEMDPVTSRYVPSDDEIAAYAEPRRRSEVLAASVLGSDPAPLL